MQLVLIVSRTDDDSRERELHRFDTDEEVLGGSAVTSNLPLRELPESAFRLARDEHGALRLGDLADGVGATHNGAAVGGEGVQVRNGDFLTVGPYAIRVTVAFPQRSARVAAGISPVIVLLLIAGVLVAEVCVATWLPAYVAEQRQWGRALTREKTKQNLDRLRGRIAYWTSDATPDEDTQQTLQMLKAEGDRMAHFLRRHSRKLSPRQIYVFARKIERMHAVLDRMKQGRLYHTPETADLDAVLHKILREEEED